MKDTEKGLANAFQAHSGGVGTPLTPDEQDKIRDGMKNCAENTNPYDAKKLVEGGMLFMENHPIEWIMEK